MRKYTKSHQLYFTNIYINVLIEACHLLLTVRKRRVSKLFVSINYRQLQTSLWVKADNNR